MVGHAGYFPDRLAQTIKNLWRTAHTFAAASEFVLPNVEANRQFAAGRVWARLLKPKLGPPQRVRLSGGLGVGALDRGARLRSMNAHVDNLLDEALTLPTSERSALVVALLDSLEGSEDPSILEAWRLEIDRRRAGLRDGNSVAVPWADARARLASL